MMERKAYTAFGETGFGELGFGKSGFSEMGFGETGRHSGEGYPASVIVAQNLSWEIESDAFLKSTKHMSGCWCSHAFCISILRFVICSLVLLPCRNPTCLSAISVFCLYSDLFLYDPKKDLACM